MSCFNSQEIKTFLVCTKDSLITRSIQNEQKMLLFFTLMNSCARNQFLPFTRSYSTNLKGERKLTQQSHHKKKNKK